MQSSGPTPATLERLQGLLEQMQPALQRVAAEEIGALDPDRLWDTAEAALQAQDHEQAVILWCRLAQLHPAEAACHFGLGLALQMAGSIETAGRHFSYAFALDPTDAACAFRLGECLLALGWTVAARDALLAAQQLCELPHNPPEIGQWARQLAQQLD